MREEMCECTVIHKETVEKVKESMQSDDLLFDLAELFKIFGDSTRMKIICALKMSELCVCDIACITNSTQSAISHQLRILKQAKLIRARKVGKVVYYSLADDHVEKIFEIGCEHIEEI
ncbi:MAG: winged helix-turn-helix transcriptional regulator [Bacilli bacterium]|nr:winged helix-turn-helix transcriptional regulator [Bacilli bacterium]